VRGIELQALRCARADMAFRADRREDVILDRLEIGRYRSAAGAAGRDGLTVLIQALAIARAARQEGERA